MCPACMASAALVAGSVMSTGGVAALVAKVVRSKNSSGKENSNFGKDRRSDHGYIEPGHAEHGKDE